MKKMVLMVCLSATLILHGVDNLRINKQGACCQQFDLTEVSNLSFANPGSSKLKIKKLDGSELLIALTEITNLSFNGTSIETTDFFQKKGVGLLTNYPNPFNPTTEIRFATSVNSLVKVEIFNQVGQLVSVLHNGKLNTGLHTMQWHAQNASTGTYFVRVSSNGETVSSKMLLLK